MALWILGIDLEQEDDAAGLLGVTIVHHSETGLIEIRKDVLINGVIDALVLDHGWAKTEWNPAKAKPLVNNEDGLHMSRQFRYSSDVGMIL